MYPFQEYGYRYPSPGVSSGYSSGVSTPAMTPPLLPPNYVYESMMANQPVWMSGVAKPQDQTLLTHILQLQQQTNQIVSAMMAPQPVYYPQQVQRQHTPCIPVGAFQDPGNIMYLNLAQQVLNSAPQIDEATLARAVLVVANAMNSSKTGYISQLRSSMDTMTPPIITPTAVRFDGNQESAFYVNTHGHVLAANMQRPAASSPPSKSSSPTQSPQATPGFGPKPAVMPSPDDDDAIYN